MQSQSPAHCEDECLVQEWGLAYISAGPFAVGLCITSAKFKYYVIWGLSNILSPKNNPFAALSRTFRGLSPAAFS